MAAITEGATKRYESMRYEMAPRKTRTIPRPIEPWASAGVHLEDADGGRARLTEEHSSDSRRDGREVRVGSPREDEEPDRDANAANHAARLHRSQR